MSEPYRIVFRLTNSQRMAVLSYLMEHWTKCDNVSESFIDCSTDPATETTIGDLLNVFMNTSEVDRGKVE